MKNRPFNMMVLGGTERDLLSIPLDLLHSDWLRGLVSLIFASKKFFSII